ncbi:MAG: hypothetical protein JXR49_18280 [Acidobacteria bacterium]|nr:hypothetical protein [Acidobacteriota bacterium]
MRIPAIALVLSEFYEQEKEKAYNEGMPNIRTQWVLGPVWAKTKEQLKKDVINGVNPISGRPVMQEIVEKFTKPLSEEDKKTGEIKRTKGPLTFTDTEENLHKMFLDKRYTDFLPIVLPTEERVAEMLKGTSRDPDEVIGRMSPTNTGGYFEYWTFTVKDVAINAVMAGCNPEYLPLLLAVASTGKEAISVSDNGFVGALVINGDIRDEIGLNYDVAAVGPYAHANTTIGRAWSLIAINLGNCGKVGTTYMGTIGNPMNLINIVIAENEEKSPYPPFSVRRGFQKGESVVTLFEGWGILSAANWGANRWGSEMDYPQIMKDITAQQGFLFGTCFVLSPPIANFVKERFETMEELEAFLAPAPAFGGGFAKMKPKPSAEGGEPAAKKPMPKGKMPAFGGSSIPIIVTGGSNNNYWSAGGLRPSQSVLIDEWR